MDEKQISELLECSVCLERLDQTCKVLPCQHTFCRRCLDEILFTKQELRCPECRALVTVRVADLPTNILVVRILEGLKTKGVRGLSSSPYVSGYGISTSKPAAPTRGNASSSHPRREAPSFHRQGSSPCAKALYNFESDVPEDLKFKVGDIIHLKRQIDDNWFQGEFSGTVGYFPANFVQVLVPLSQVPQCKALYDFVSHDEGEKDCLSFKKDEILTVIRRVDENWVEGRKGDKIGIFPLVFVELNDQAAKLLISSKINRPVTYQSSAPPTTAISKSNTPVAPSTTNRSLSAPSGTLLPSSVSVAGDEDTILKEASPSSPSVPDHDQAVGTTAIKETINEESSRPILPSSGSVTDSIEQSSDETALLQIDVAPEAESTSVKSNAALTPPPSSSLSSSPSHTAPSPGPLNKRHSYTPCTMTPLVEDTLSPSSLPSSSISLLDTHERNILDVSSHLQQTVSNQLEESSDMISSSSNQTQAKVFDPLNRPGVPLPHHSASTSQTVGSQPSDNQTESSSSSSSNSSLTIPIYTAMYNYKPQKDDEVELLKGEQYTVVEKCQDGWFKGACLRTGQSGVFPGNYVNVNRLSSAFKPVHPNVLNIRAKGPVVCSGNSNSNSGISSHQTPTQSGVLQQEQVTNKGSTVIGTANAPPPLLPRVAKMVPPPQGTKSISPAPRSLSQSAGSTSIITPSRPMPLTCSEISSSPGRSSSTSSASHLAGVSIPSRPGVPALPPSILLLGKQTESHSTSPAHRSAHPMPSLAAVSAMSASASITAPPNVVMQMSHHSPIPQDKEKKEKKEKEKKGLVKLFGGKGKKNKQTAVTESPDNSTMAVLCFDSSSHNRSGSHTSDTHSMVGLSAGDASSHGNTFIHHRKGIMLDMSGGGTGTTPPIPAKPRQRPAFRERYCCIVPYPPQTEHELSLELGDIIHVHRKRDDGWYKGTQERTGKTGMFPASFVEKF